MVVVAFWFGFESVILIIVLFVLCLSLLCWLLIVFVCVMFVCVCVLVLFMLFGPAQRYGSGGVSRPRADTRTLGLGRRIYIYFLRGVKVS